jgi:hypothetical protein
MARTVREIYLKEFTNKTSKRHAFLMSDSHHVLRHFSAKYVMEFTQTMPAPNASAGLSNDLLSINGTWTHTYSHLESLAALYTRCQSGCADPTRRMNFLIS